MSASSVPLDGPHWDFSLSVYRRPRVPESCLLLQDRWGLDVNLLLMAAYAAASGRAPDLLKISATDLAVAPWREEIVKALRALRRRLKDGPAPAPDETTNGLRDRIKAAELMAEQIEQARLAGLLLADPPDLSSAADPAAILQSLHRVIEHTTGEASFDQETQEAIRVIAEAVSAWRQEAK